MRRQKQDRQTGIALVEALLALAVMAFGMLAVVGVQATLRQNADVAKQRSEAVRIAQAEIERWRAYAGLQAAGGLVSYGNLQDATLASVAGGNADYSVTRSVEPDQSALILPYPIYKTYTVDVGWTDRNGLPQSVRLSTAVAAVAPQLSGTLGVPASGDPFSQPGGRNRSVPPSARDWGGGSSDFVPPGQPGNNLVGWRFDNITGEITFCTTNITSTALLTASTDFTCGPNKGTLLSGFVRFATGAAQPDAATAEFPPIGLALNLDVELTLTSPNHPSPGSICFDDAPLTLAAAATVAAVNYYCAILASPANTWTGISNLVPRAFTDAGAVVWTIAASGAPAYKVCRYTPAANDTAVIANAMHPRNYSTVTKPLTRQNFLVIAAANTCPTDMAANPATGDFVNSNTLVHQPAP